MKHLIVSDDVQVCTSTHLPHCRLLFRHIISDVFLASTRFFRCDIILLTRIADVLNNYLRIVDTRCTFRAGSNGPIHLEDLRTFVHLDFLFSPTLPSYSEKGPAKIIP